MIETRSYFVSKPSFLPTHLHNLRLFLLHILFFLILILPYSLYLPPLPPQNVLIFSLPFPSLSLLHLPPVFLPQAHPFSHIYHFPLTHSFFPSPYPLFLSPSHSYLLAFFLFLLHVLLLNNLLLFHPHMLLFFFLKYSPFFITASSFFSLTIF